MELRRLDEKDVCPWVQILTFFISHKKSTSRVLILVAGGEMWDYFVHCTHQLIADRRSKARLSLVVEPTHPWVQILTFLISHKKSTSRVLILVAGG